MERREATMGRRTRNWMTARFGVPDEVSDKSGKPTSADKTPAAMPEVVNEVRGGQTVIVFKGGLDVRTQRFPF